jgi:hypothetical protein
LLEHWPGVSMQEQAVETMFSALDSSAENKEARGSFAEVVVALAVVVV